MEDAIVRGWLNLLHRLGGPMHFRFIVQPVIAALLGVRAGLRDARVDEPPFLVALVRHEHRDRRRERMRRAWSDIGKVFLMAAALDATYQVWVQRGIFLLELLVTATLLALVPYGLVRGATCRLARALRARRAAFSLALAALFVTRGAIAQGREQPVPAAENKLARDVQNPVARLTSIPLQNEAEMGIGPHDRVRNTLSLQPTIGIGLSREVGVVSRTKLPFVSQPEIQRDSGYTSGLGDITQSLLVVPNATADVVWGVGSSVVLPTATRNELGFGKLAIGPTAAVVVQLRPWMFGVLASQLWSVAGASNRQDVSPFIIMPVVTYVLARGWYVSSSPIVTANWNAASSGDTWTVPVGGGGGKVFVVDQGSVNVSAAVYWNAIRPDSLATPSMRAQLQVAFLFPR